MKRKGIILLALLTALLLAGCGGPVKWEPLTGAQMDQALMMEDKLISRDTLKKNGILFEYTGADSYGGYLDWWNQDVRAFLRSECGSGVDSTLKECEEKVDMDKSVASRNNAMRSNFIDLRKPNSYYRDYYRYEYGLFQDYRTTVLKKLLFPSRKQNSRNAEDPVRVLLVDGSDCIGVDKKGIMPISAASRSDIVQRAQEIWAGLTAGHPGDFVLVSDPRAADVIINLYVSYANGGTYGTIPNLITVQSCHLNLFAISLFTGTVKTERYDNKPGNTVSVRGKATNVWMKLPKLDEAAVPFMDEILSWFKGK